MEFHDRDISCYNTPLLIKYANSLGIAEDVFFLGIEEYRELLMNPREWADARIVIKMLNNFVKASGGNDEVLVNAGIEITKQQATFFQLFFLKIAPLSLISKNLTKHIENTVTTCMKMSLTLQGPGKARYIVRPDEKYPDKYASCICAYDKGCAIGTLMLKGVKNFATTENSCAAIGSGKECIYEFTWDPEPPFLEKIKSWFSFRVKSQPEILSHMQSSHDLLQAQYKHIQSLQEFYSRIMATMEEAVVWCRSDMAIEFSNVGFERMTGIGDIGTKERQFFDFVEISAQDGAALMEFCKKRPLVPKTVKFNIVPKHGKKKIGEASVMWVTGGDRDSGFLIVIRDITKAVQLEKQLYLAENRYRSLYENSPALIVGMDLDGKIIFANNAMVKRTGFTEDELKAMSFKDLVAPNLSDAEMKLVFAERLKTSSRLQEVHFKIKDSTWLSLALNTYPMRDDEGHIAGLAGIGVDITETQRLNEQIVRTQRMEMLGQLSAGLVHDFNNILASISGYGQLIGMNTAEPGTKQKIGTILSAVDRATHLVVKLKSFAQADAKTVLVRVLLNDIASEAGELVRSAVVKVAKLEVVIPSQPYYVNGDSDELHQIIMNLCINARDAFVESNRSNSRIVLRVVPSPVIGYVRIEVEDTGPGIPPHIIEKIFDPFFTTKKDRGGTGLGLSMVYKSVKTHKGNIVVDSRPGQGTTMQIDLPIALDGEQVAAPYKRGKGTVLVYDDDAGARGFFIETLRHYGYGSVEFSDADSALDWLRSHDSETWLVIADTAMTEMSPAAFAEKCAVVKAGIPVVWLGHTTDLTGVLAHIKLEFVIGKPLSSYDFFQRMSEIEKVLEGGKIG